MKLGQLNVNWSVAGKALDNLIVPNIVQSKDADILSLAPYFAVNIDRPLRACNDRDLKRATLPKDGFKGFLLRDKRNLVNEDPDIAT